MCAHKTHEFLLWNMSSTNRSNARKEHISDYYVTPIPDIELFLEEFDKRVYLNWSKRKIIDCCAGGNEEKVFSLGDKVVGIDENDASSAKKKARAK